MWIDDCGTRNRGRVTQVLRKTRRVVSDTGRRQIVPVMRLARAPDTVLILEGRLDRSLNSRRTCAPILQLLLMAYGTKAYSEKIHTGLDLRFFLKREARKSSHRIIHIICHGLNDSPDGALLQLTHDKVKLMECLADFEGLCGKILILSACEVGANRRTMEALKKASGACAVIAYRKSVYDTYTNLAEALLYEQLLNSNVAPSTAVERVHEALSAVKTKPCDDKYRGNVMVCV